MLKYLKENTTYVRNLIYRGQSTFSHTIKKFLKPMQKTNPALAYLFPCDIFWGKNFTLISKNNKNYTLDNVKEIFTLV